MEATRLNLPSCSDLPNVTSLVIRTDFSDEEAWLAVRRAIETPTVIKWTNLYGRVDYPEFSAFCEFISDPEFEGLTIEALVAHAYAAPQEHDHVFIVDWETLSNPEHPILVVDMGYFPEYEQFPGRFFRLIPTAMWNVQNNLSVSNCDFEDYLDDLDEQGIFRSFLEADVRENR